MKSFLLLLALLTWVDVALAHDAWLQTNTNIARSGDTIHLDLMLGNHGNDHRDFKLAGKLNLEGAAVSVAGPSGAALDLKPTLADVGYSPQEGFWAVRFQPQEPGLYVVGYLADQVMSYGPVRSVKGAKAYFVASPSLDRVPPDNPGFDRQLGHPLELVPLANPVTPMGPGVPIRLRLLYRGKPLADARVSFIPRGTTLSEQQDATYDRSSDADGRVSFTPTFGNQYLVAAHHENPNESGKGYNRTKYSATLCVFVPQICPCCQE